MADRCLCLMLARGALLSPFRRPRPDAEFPRTRLVLPGVRVDPARLAAYERVCGFPAGGDTLPVTHPHVLAFPLAMALMSRRDFPLPLLGLVHTSLAIEQRRALPASGTYELTVQVAGLAPHRRGTEATVVTEVRAGGDLAWASRSTYLARHRTAVDAPVAGGRPLNARDIPPARTRWRLSGDIGRRYAAASGDRNPIHLHPLTARPFGFPRAVAHGMWTLARCLAELGTPQAAAVRAEFRAPVLLPATVTYAADGTRFALLGDGRRPHVVGEVRPLTG
ncbi:MaoC/PaaZ C-terminal domain-containing protein [Streptomyces sp. CRN 30]|uniref:MaoC/PaaZ C-terminal domain-containing protein n=1 Tax=Streptomyces sp. CRN 30 TaxID=3075613 RepID=UPI002A7FC51A|nr:MaoC/PaaZ C-terminal domain-containing protein [Streptomyces sp. CRN 30]